MIDDNGEVGATEPEVKDEPVDTNEGGEVAEEATETQDETENEEGAEQNEEAGEETDEEGEETAEEDGGQPKKPLSRFQKRLAFKEEQIRKQEREEKEKLIADRAKALAELEFYRQQQQQVQNNFERQAEEERLSLLSPEEKRIYELNKHTKMLEHRLNLMEMRRADDVDRAAFHAKAAHDPAYAKYADKVEQMYQEGLQRGVNASREDLHSYILGQELKKDMAAKMNKKKEVASKRVASVTSKPVTGKSDVSGTKTGKSAEDRLRGVLI
jgi:hypothetical protein